MKKKLLLVLLLVLSLGLYGCGKQKDGEKFKEEYESVNGQKSGENTIRTLSIPKDNPFIYKETKDIVKAIQDKETFVVYFGFVTCPWCRSVLPYLIKTAEENNIDEIYYVDIKNLRDTVEYDEETGELKTTKEGDKDYLKLVDLLSSVLNKYSISDANGNDVSDGRKRIYAPNVVVIENGIPLKMESGISDYQDEPYMELNERIIEDTEKKFNDLFAVLHHDVCTKEEGC